MIKGLLAIIGSHRLNELEEYLSTSEKQLRKAQVDFEAWFKEQEQGLSPEEQRDFYDFYGDEYWLYAERFPRILRNSFFISCWFLLEREMVAICRRLKRDKQIQISLSDLRRDIDILERGKLYFKLAGLLLSYDDKTWEELKHYYKVRNCIVHQNGLVKELQNDQDFITYIRQKSIISDDTIEQEIALTEQFCREVISTVRTFLGRLWETYESKA
jgi:hypothetical protein